MSAATDATEILGALAAGAAVLKSLYELGEEVFPSAKTFVLNFVTMFLSYVNGTEITDEQLAKFQEETTAMSEACHAAYLKKYGAP